MWIVAQYFRRVLTVAVTVGLVSSIAACGSAYRINTASLGSLESHEGSEQVLPSPSALRDISYWPTDLERDGSGFVDTWPNRNVEAAGANLVFTPSWQLEAEPPVTESAYAVYGFDLDAYDRDAAVRFDWASPQPDSSDVWIGLSNMVDDIWEWCRYPEYGVVDFDRDVHFDSERRIAVAVVVTGTQSYTLRSLRLGDPNAWWFTTWGRSGFESAGCITLGSDNSLYLGGFSENPEIEDDYDAIVAKYTREGDAVWNRIWGTPGRWDEVSAIAVNDAGEVLLTGRIYSDPEGEPNTMVMKLSDGGEVQWQQALVTYQDSWGHGIGIDQDNCIYVTGEASYVDEEQRVRVIPLIKYDDDGVLQWQVGWRNDATDFAYGYSLAVDTSLGEPYIYVAGSARYFEQTWYDIVLLKFDADGNLVWQRAWGQPAGEIGIFEYTRSLALDPDGNVFIHGYMTDLGVEDEIQDVIVLKFSPDGDLLWARQWGTPEYDDYGGDKCNGSAVDSDGNFYFATRTWGVTGKLSESLALVKYSPTGSLSFSRVWIPNNLGETAGSCLAIDESDVLYVGGRSMKAYGCWYAFNEAVSQPIAGWLRPPDGYVTEIDGTVTELDSEPVEYAGVVDTGGGNDDLLMMKYTPYFSY
jgi:hypothetical protein